MDDVTKYGPVDGDPIVDKEEIPYETKREFDKDQRLVQRKLYKKVKMEKNNHNTNNENPLTNEIVDKGTPTEEITKEAVDEIVHYGGEEIKPGHKDEFDPNAPKGSKEDVPGKPGIKIQKQEKL